MSDQTKLRYAVVSPVKDEEPFVELTLRSMVAQTVAPLSWVIVDDGSTDRCPEIVAGYAARYPFIRLVRHRSGGARHTGSPVIHAFWYGCTFLVNEQYDLIVKLDCDLSFEPDYFEKLLKRFDADDRLGIASGVYLEPGTNGTWNAVSMPGYHAFGASKVVRRRCFEEIGGFAAAPGWDTVDEIKALRRGWRTGHFADLPVRHHKREGSGIGQLRTSRMHGEIYYTSGGDPLFLIFKILHRLAIAPVVLSALALTYGYVSALIRRRPLLVDRSEARFYRRLLRRRLTSRAGVQPPVVQPLLSDR
jgi:glycosyltransferase involved in cell wall biosynthesis